VLAGAGFLAGLLVVAGPGATQVGVNAMIALLVFGRNAAGPEIAALHAAWVMAGGLVQTGLALLIRSPRPLQTQREALARLAAATRRAQSTVTASLERARGEPARIRPDVAGYTSALAAGRRTGAARSSRPCSTR